MGTLLSGDRQSEIDHVYGVYFDMDSMLGDRRFDVAANDSVIVGDARYPGTPSLYELIFKRLPDDVVYTENDKQTYKSILLITNAHRHGHNAVSNSKSFATRPQNSIAQFSIFPDLEIFLRSYFF
ncbi:hypothetical protein P5V15_002606 [Pogonomyrmex californicus]